MSTLCPTGHPKFQSSPAYERIVKEAPMTPAQDATALAELADEMKREISFYVSSYEHHDLMVRAEAALRRAALRSTPSASAGPQADAVREQAFKTAEILESADEIDASMRAFLAKQLRRALAHPQPQQADGRGAVIEALKEAIAVFEGMCDDEIEVDLLPRLRAALSQAPATDGAGSSHTRPHRGTEA